MLARATQFDCDLCAVCGLADPAIISVIDELIYNFQIPARTRKTAKHMCGRGVASYKLVPGNIVVLQPCRATCDMVLLQGIWRGAAWQVLVCTTVT